MNTFPRDGEIVVTLSTDNDESRDADAPASQQVEALERTADDLRDNLGALVSELGRRGQRVLLPLALGTAALGVAGVTGVLLWRRRQTRKTSPVGNLALAVRRAAAHPKRVATRQPGGLSKIAIAAAAAVASVIARRLAQRWLDQRNKPVAALRA